MARPEAISAWECESGDWSGQPHVWEYLGKVAQSYLCGHCLCKISKSRLKEDTDNA